MQLVFAQRVLLSGLEGVRLKDSNDLEIHGRQVRVDSRGRFFYQIASEAPTFS